MSESYKHTLGVTMGIVSAICFSTKAILTKIAYSHGADAIQILFLRLLFAFPFYIGIAYYYQRKSNVSLTVKDWIYVLILGWIGYYLSSLFDFIGLEYVPASLERLILFTYPTLTVLFYSIWNKSALSQKDYLGLALTYIGIGIIYIGNASLTEPDILWGSFLIFCCAITYALYLVGSGHLIPKIGAQRYTSYAMLSSTLAIFLHYFISNGIPELHSMSSTVLTIGLLLGIVATVIPSLTLALSIQWIGTEKSSILATLGPVITILLANLILEEPFTLRQFIGTIGILVGVWIVGKK
ncbi:MAG: DMT family transporter [Cytophagaceae bacterium]|nr:DMT family transporter [Cytophagaceae bacterium]